MASLSKKIIEEVNAKPEGTVFSIDQITNGIRSKNRNEKFKILVSKVLSNLYNQGEIDRIRQGTFFKPKYSPYFGKMEPEGSEILKILMIQHKDWMFGGPTLFNQIKLSLQVPSIITVLNNKSNQTMKLAQSTVKLIRISAPISEENLPLLATLEVIKNNGSISDSDPVKTFSWLSKKFIENSKMIHKLVRFADRYYPKKVLVFCGALIEKLIEEGKLNEGLKSSIVKIRKNISYSSRYRIGPISSQFSIETIKRWNINETS